MSGIAGRIAAVRASIATACGVARRDPATVMLLPVSKHHPVAAVREARECGLVTFGENRVQELTGKAAALAETDVRWHMIGSLQTNKVQALLRVPGLEMLQSLDRIPLADALQRALGGSGRTLAVLLQIDATGEAAKHGALPGEAHPLLQHVLESCPLLRPEGVMAMGPLDGDPAPVFAAVARLHDELRQRTGRALPVRSMGMTDDMPAAIAAGSTLVRVGTGIFGSRPEGAA